MPLTPGTRLGPCEIVAPLGQGGMGEVYRAKDTRLGREVAIEGLPEAFAGHPERLARFEREARQLASLGHPNIDATRVWPLEAPMTHAEVHRLFREVKIESGLSPGSDVR